MNKKYLIMFGSLFAFILIVFLTVTILSSCNRKVKDETVEKKLVKAAQKYASKEEIKMGESIIVDADKLASEGYIKKLSELNDNNCSGYVKIMNNGGVLNYLPYIECDKYKTATIRQTVIDDQLTTGEDGLYYENGEYIFKGKEPNNYVKIDGSLWVILKIDKDGDLKLLSVDSGDEEVFWDNKFNDVEELRTGENDYKTSYIREYIIKEYNSYKDSNKQHIIPKSICIGKRRNEDVDKSSLLDCSEMLDGEYISLINPSDYALASLDKDCSSLVSGNCMNYNYLYNVLDNTWTVNAIKDSTYEAIMYVNKPRTEPVGEFAAAQVVIYISGDELYAKGDGTPSSPYEYKIIK